MDEKVTQVVQAMNELVTRDGGEVTVLSFEERALRVEYRLGINDECPTCLITPEVLHDFLFEGLRSHEVPVDEVVVVTP